MGIGTSIVRPGFAERNIIKSIVLENAQTDFRAEDTIAVRIDRDRNAGADIFQRLTVKPWYHQDSETKNTMNDPWFHTVHICERSGAPVSERGDRSV